MVLRLYRDGKYSVESGVRLGGVVGSDEAWRMSKGGEERSPEVWLVHLTFCFPVMIPLPSEHARNAIWMLQCFLGIVGTRKRIHPERRFAGFECGRGYDPALVFANDGDDNGGQRAGVMTANCANLATCKQNQSHPVFDSLQYTCFHTI